MTLDFLPSLSTFYPHPRLFTLTLDFLPSPSTLDPRHSTLDKNLNSVFSCEIVSQESESELNLLWNIISKLSKLCVNLWSCWIVLNRTEPAVPHITGTSDGIVIRRFEHEETAKWVGREALKALNFRLKRCDEVLGNEDGAAIDRHRESITAIVSTISILKGSIEEAKFA
jgi:hypothetical protein